MRWALALACAVGVHGKHGCSNHHGCGAEVKVLNTGDLLPDGSAPLPDGKVPFKEHDLVPVPLSSTASTPGNKSTAASTSNKSTTEPPLSQGKKCLDALGEAVWCSSSTAVVDGASEGLSLYPASQRERLACVRPIQMPSLQHYPSH